MSLTLPNIRTPTMIKGRGGGGGELCGQRCQEDRQTKIIPVQKPEDAVRPPSEYLTDRCTR
jgi:hypothetical protein